MGFPRQEHWSGLPFPPPGDLPDPGIKLETPVAPALAADSWPLSHVESPFSYDTAPRQANHFMLLQLLPALEGMLTGWTDER